jgi:hypothetical protein
MSMKDMVGVIKDLKGGEKSDSTMLVEMMKEMRMEREATNKLILEGMKDRIERSEKLVEKLMEQKAATPASTEKEGSQVSNLMTGVDQIVSVVEKLGFRKNGVGISSPEPSGVAAWLPDVMQAAQGIISAGVQAWTVKMQADDRERSRQMAMQTGQPIPMGPVMQMPQMPQPIQPQQPNQIPQPQLPPQQPTADMTANPANPAPPQTADEDAANFYKFMSEIHRPIMNHIRRNLGGAAFAQWIIDSYDESTFEQIRSQGKEALVEGLMSYPPLAKDLAGLQGPLVMFADEFVRMEEILAEDALDDGDGGEDEGEGEEAGI